MHSLFFSEENKGMKTAALFSAVVAFLLPVSSFAQVSQEIFTRNLSLGSRGEDVRALQVFLNKDPQTAVALSGTGSAGRETDSFGALTKAAVIRFQEKYSQEVLIPGGFYRGTGVFGPLSRKKVLSLSVLVQSTSSVVSPLPSTPKPSEVAPVKNVQATTSPLGTIRFDKDAFLKALDTVGTEQGYNKDQLSTIKDVVVKDIAVQNPEKRFLEDVQKNGIPIHGLPAASVTGGRFSLFLDSVFEFFTGKKVYAATGTPFGGRILFPFFCTCSGSWLIFLLPTAPTYATLLTYYSGTQIYLGYNLPFSLNTLGEYTPGAQCQIYIGYGCATLPSQGQISPKVGSSL